MHKKILGAKYQLFGVASFAPPQGSHSRNFSKKAGNCIFSFYMISFISLFMGSNKLVVGFTQNISTQEKVRCLMFTAPASMVNKMNFYILPNNNHIRNELRFGVVDIRSMLVW